jgi:major membrane immunogen (membrane-anchored lipoprotein)
MKKNLLLTMVMLAASSLLAADASSKDEVIGAATALGNQPNYSWHSTIENGNNGARRGPTDGKTEKDGYTTVSIMANDATIQLAFHGTNGAIKTADTDWQSVQEASQAEGGGFNFAVFMARIAQNFQAPAVEVADLASHTQSLTAGTNGISGDLTEEGAKSLLLFRRGGTGGATASNAKGSVTFWITDGKLVKYQMHITGTINYNSNDRDVDRTTTTEIKDVGTTKVEVPDDAKKKLE